MDNDGTKSGYNLPLTKAVSDSVGIPVIASGGVGELQHLVDGVIKGHASAVLAASIFILVNLPYNRRKPTCKNQEFR